VAKTLNPFSAQQHCRGNILEFLFELNVVNLLSSFAVYEYVSTKRGKNLKRKKDKYKITNLNKYTM